LCYFNKIILLYLACGPLNVCSTLCTLALYQQLSDVLLTTHIYILNRKRKKIIKNTQPATVFTFSQGWIQDFLKGVGWYLEVAESMGRCTQNVTI